MTIVYASDKNYSALTAISAVSALRHNPGARIVLLGYNLDEEAQEIVRSRVKKAGGDFLYCDVSGAIEELKGNGYNGYTSFASYARVFIAEVLPNEEGRILYLDGDTLVAGSLNDLFEIDMGGKPFAFGMDCVPRSYKKVVRMSQEASYFNSGVMLIDMREWRRRCCKDRFFEALSGSRGVGVFPDQDVFNRFFQDDIALLPPKWNYISHFFLFSYDGLARIVGGRTCLRFTRKEYVDAQRDPRIFHFLGNTLGRPWYDGSRHPLREAYRKAAAEADLAEFAEQIMPMLPDYVLQYYLHKFLPQFAFDIICSWLYRINIWRNYHV